MIWRMLDIIQLYEFHKLLYAIGENYGLPVIQEIIWSFIWD